MNAASYASPRTGRAMALCLIVGAHILVALFWPARQSDGDQVREKGGEKALTIAFVILPVPKTQAPTAAVVPPRSRRVTLPPAPTIKLIPAAPSTPSVPPVPPVPSEAPAPAAEPAAATPVSDAIALQAKKDAGKIDRELRSQSLDDGLRNMKLHPDKFERAIAGALKERGPPRMVEEVLSDGTRRTRVGNICAQKESNSVVGGRDVFRDGIRTKWSSCPR